MPERYIKKIDNQKELRFEIGRVCLSLKVKHPEIRKRVRLHYKDYVSNRKPDIYIDIEYKDFFKKPNLKSLLFQTPSWKLGRENGHFILYFPGRNRVSLARFNDKSNYFKFYTEDPSGQLLLYLFPELLFSLILPQNKALMLHACGVLDGKKSYLFIATAGGGKSTLAKLALKNGLTVLNDDRIIISDEKKSFKVYGNPWHGDVEETSNKSSYINKVFFLKKSKFNQIRPISKAEAVAELFKNSFFLPINSDIIRNSFNICSNLAENLDCYRLGFKPDESIWRFLDGLAKQNS